MVVCVGVSVSGDGSECGRVCVVVSVYGGESGCGSGGSDSGCDSGSVVGVVAVVVVF